MPDTVAFHFMGGIPEKNIWFQCGDICSVGAFVAFGSSSEDGLYISFIKGLPMNSDSKLHLYKLLIDEQSMVLYITTFYSTLENILLQLMNMYSYMHVFMYVNL